MHPVNGNKGIEKGQFFQGFACIPFEISRKTQIGSLVAKERKNKELVEFLQGNIPLMKHAASKFLDRLEGEDSPLAASVFLAALPGLMMIIEKHDIYLAFRASARIAARFPKDEVLTFPSEKYRSSVLGTVMRTVFRSMEDWAMVSGKMPKTETVKRVRTNLLFFIGMVILSGTGRRLSVNRKDIDSIVHLISDEHPGVINNSLFCLRMALEKDPDIWNRFSFILPTIRMRSAHPDKELALEAKKVLTLLEKNELIGPLRDPGESGPGYGDEGMKGSP